MKTENILILGIGALIGTIVLGDLGQTVITGSRLDLSPNPSLKDFLDSRYEKGININLTKFPLRFRVRNNSPKNITISDARFDLRIGEGNDQETIGFISTNPKEEYNIGAKGDIVFNIELTNNQVAKALGLKLFDKDKNTESDQQTKIIELYNILRTKVLFLDGFVKLDGKNFPYNQKIKL